MEHQNSVGEVNSMAVDPFLVEALQNPRHRLTILRMELDIQKFIQNSEQHQFEFQHFPTSYLRLAAHRVAQHYGLQTMVLENFSDGQGTRILVKKLAEAKLPAICLSDVPTKLSENEKHEHVKVVLKPRPKLSSDGENVGMKSNSIKTVEERKEDYDRARARIFSSPGSPQSENTPLRTNSDGKNLCFSGDESEGYRNSAIELERSLSRDANGNTSRVAIIRDREKDLTDPDYDRSYDRYVRNLPVGQGFNLLPLTLPKFQPCVQYDAVMPHLAQTPNAQAPLGYRSPPINPYAVMGVNHVSRDAVYMQWPSHSMMYAHSYDQFRHAVFQQAPFCQQQPLSFDYSQNH